MPTEAIHKLEPHRTLYLRGFDRRGASASLHNATASGFTVSGSWADQADFAVLNLFDVDDNFGHLFTTKYLPDFSLHNATLDFDLAITGAQHPISSKYQSVPWGSISYITASENPSGTTGYPNIALKSCATSAIGMSAAGATYTVSGTPVSYDRIQLIYLSNVVWDYTYTAASFPSTLTFAFFNYFGTGYTHSITIGSNTYNHVQLSTDGSGDIAIALANAINTASDPNAHATVSANDVILTAISNSGATITCTASDGNGPGTLLEFTSAAAMVCGAMVNAINGTNWTLLAPTLAIMAQVISTGDFAVYAANYGTVNTSGTAVTLASGTNFLGNKAGDTIVINLVPYTIQTVNSTTSLTLTASAGTQTGVNFLAPGGGRDGNAIELLSMNKTSTLSLTPSYLTAPVTGVTCQKLVGGTDPTSVHFHVDFTALAIDSVRQMWLTFAAPLKYDAGASSGALVPFTSVTGSSNPNAYPVSWSAVFTNWTLADPSSVLPLKIAGPGSVTVGSTDSLTTYAGTSWAQQPGYYYLGFSKVTANPTDKVTIKYTCQHSHNLYLGTSLLTSGGKFTTTVDGVAQATIDTYADASTPVQTRRLIATGIAPGAHTVVLTVAATHNALSTGYNCTFDYLQAAVLSDVQSPATTYSGANCACDFDTNQTYSASPARVLWILNKAGFNGDIDFYSGVFFGLKRTRYGGDTHSATVTISAGGSGFNLGTLFGDGDQIFLQLGGNVYGDGLGTAFGVSVFPTDTADTLACRFVNAINSLFVGVYASYTGTGQLTITPLSPINGFTLFSHYVAGTGASGAYPSTGTITIAGDILSGNEGVWQVDASQTQPLNQGFVDYLTDFCGLVHAAGQSMTVSFSQELLAPPDANTSAGAWTQRYASGVPVLTSTGFGSWGAGVVQFNGSLGITQPGHGYITGNTVHIASATQSGVWVITVTDSDHYLLTTRVADNGSGGLLFPSYTPAVGDLTFIDLQTSQCTFNPSTVTPYLTACYKQAAGVMSAAGLVPWLQFGEVLWWFFSRIMSVPIGYASYTSPISIGTNTPHGFVTGQRVINAGILGNTAANGDWTITVTDATHYTLNGSSGNGNYVAGTGTASGGGMAYYDANTAAAALSALGRALATFYHQDEDPTVNSSADANFLAARLKSHIDSVRAGVLASYSNAKFELLWPYDVNFRTCYYTSAVPYPQGGRLNRAVNFPVQYNSQSGSGLDRLKIEALSWGATYRNLTNAQAAITFPFTSPCNWPNSATAYLIPWFNGGCPWPAEYFASKFLPLLNFWALDHLVLLSWPLPLPVPAGTVSIT